MTEKDITICGHGSGTPSLKNLNEYLTMRYSQKMSNGVRKGLLAVRRLKALDTDGERQHFHDTYRTILGRNVYDQDLRQFVYTPYKGRYYSDCSSSGCATYQRCGAEIALLNTAGMLTSDLFYDVDCGIKDGHILHPEKLRVGDALLFAGNLSRPSLQYVGHVEYIYEIPITVRSGWQEEADGWKYLEKGEPIRDEWRYIDGRWYVFDGGGVMITGWFRAAEGWYYLAGDGAMCSSQWIADRGKTYYVTQTGLMAVNCYVRSDMPVNHEPEQYIYYWVGEDGAWQPQWDTTKPDLKKYYCAI